MNKIRYLAIAFGVSSLLFVAGYTTNLAHAHCDTLGGPVVMDAKMALKNKDVTPVLKWVKKDDEATIREAFKKTVAVSAKGGEARELAENYFFETLVRIHRAGEGAPYTGLKSEPVEPIIAASDDSLDSGSADKLIGMVNEHIADGIRKRHARVIETAKHANESVEAGREYVEAYVEFTHYVEGIHNAAAGPAGHAAHAEPSPAPTTAPIHEHHL